MQLTIIGAGRLGKTLGYLWQQQQSCRLQAICNRQRHSSQIAVDFIGAGKAIEDYQQLPFADLWLLACPDDQIFPICQQLAALGHFSARTTVFHCSGALTAAEALMPAKQAKAAIASIHPLKSFALPEHAIHDFSGTYCGYEGDEAALAQLLPLFITIGAKPFPILSHAKTLYHTASVLACNYLVALQELSLQTFAQAGIERQLAKTILNPIVTQTVANIFQLGTQQALTGPIARGDIQTIHKQIQALQNWQAEHAKLYQLLGKIALDLRLSQPDSPITPDTQALYDLLQVKSC